MQYEPFHSTWMKRTDKIGLISNFLLIGLGMAMLFNAFLANIIKMPFPYTTFLFNPENSLKDYYHHIMAARDLSPYFSGTIEAVYPPFTYVIFRLFSVFQPDALGMYIYSSLFFAFFLFYIYSSLAQGGRPKIKDIIIFTFFSYPVLFTVDRGNIELYLFLIMAAFIYFYKKGNMQMSVILLSMAISTKMIPAVFLVLFLADKRYKEALWTLFFTALISFLSLFLLHGAPLHNIQGYLIWQAKLLKIYGLDEMGVHYSVSMYASIRHMSYLLFHSVFSKDHMDNVAVLLRCYNIFSIICGLLLSMYVLFVEKTFWKRIFVLVSAMIILPYFSADYRLIHIFLPMFLFVNNKAHDHNDQIYAVVFALLLIPKNYFFYFLHDIRRVPDISASIYLNPALIILVLYLIISDGILYRRKAGKK
jgi:hypothetical protein